MTFDNGTEFSKHYLLSRRFGIQTWFCDTHSPWQKGGIENAIGRLRRQLPRNTDLDTLPAHRLALCLERYNDTPRKCLGFKTPNEVFLNTLFTSNVNSSLRSSDDNHFHSYFIIFLSLTFQHR